ncbi:SpoIIE family protein phosphatase [Marinomonas epiphytica]
MKLLCVDSEPVYREIVAMCARNANLDVHTVSNYQDAIESFLGWQPDIVCLDFLIQGGSGLDLVKALKSLAGDLYVPMMFLTSHASDSVMNACFQAGADDFISKPFNEVLFNIRLKTHIQHVNLIQEMYQKNKILTFYQTRNERELDMAHQVLDHILNSNEEQDDNIAITRISAASFNGDLALTKTRADGGRLIFIGDFTGHGLSASIGALPVAQTFFDAVNEHIEVRGIASKLNRTLASVLPDYMFCAAFLIHVDASNQVHYWGGGMPNAYILRSSGELEALSSQHMPLGVLSDDEFDSELGVATLESGDTLTILSDGVVELLNKHEVMLGSEQTEKLLQQSFGDGLLSEGQEKLESALLAYSKDTERKDDITVFSMRAS